MATLILTAVGHAVGGPIGGAIGAVVGQTVDSVLFAPKARHGPRLGDLAVQTSSYGTPIPKLFGTMRVAGTVIWSTDLIERRSTSGGGKGRPKTVDYSYSASFAVALSARPLSAVGRIWADGKLLRGAGGDFRSKSGFRFHHGDEDQEPDPLIAAAEGAGHAPAFRGTAYAVFEEMELADFGNRIPSLTFELVADAGPVAIGTIAAALGGIRPDGATPELLGYAASGHSVRAAIEELVELADLALVDTGAELMLGTPAGPPANLPRDRESGRRELVRRSSASVPGEVTITYYDGARDYQAGLQRVAAGPPVPEAQAERRGLAATLSAESAKAFAERRLDMLWAARASATVTCGWSQARIRPGMLVGLDGEAGSWRVRRWTLGDMRVKLELVRAASSGAPSGEASPGRAVSEPDLPHGPSVLRLYDLPLPEAAPGGGPALLALVAGHEEGWRRAEISVSFDGGASWRDVGGSAAPATIGTAVTALTQSGSALVDAEGSLEVELLHEGMALIGRSNEALAAGANLALVGNELLQFGSVEALGPSRYRLSRLLRGRRGTEWAAGLHQADEDFALIETGSVLPIGLPPGLAVGTSVRLLASGVGDAEPAAAELLVEGEALRPPAPVHFRAEPDGSGGVRLSWVRRSRLGWTWTSGSDTPLGEESERYRLTLSAAGFSRMLELSETHYSYDAAARSADGPGPVTATVVQLGTRGTSRPASIIFS